MRTPEEILDAELSDYMVEYLIEQPIFKRWIIDAMLSYAVEYHENKLLGFKYCQDEIECNKKCKTQCDHCAEYYKTLELKK